jgi:membrane-associated phospholipid phosphatase
MRYLKENRNLLFAVMSLPLFFFYLDKLIVSFLKNYVVKKSFIYDIFDYGDPFLILISHGITLMTVAVGLILFGKFYNQKCYSAGKTLLLGFISSGIMVQVLKHLTGRVRPRIKDDLVFMGPSLEKGYDSFPSGHTMEAFCFAYIFSYYFPRYRVFFYSWAVLIGIARVEGIAHFPSDVLAGAVIGIVIAKILIAKTLRADSS